MRIVGAAVLMLVLAEIAGAQSPDPDRYECPAVELSADAGPSVVVASTFIGVALRYDLGRADRVCTRRRQGREERLRSFPIRGTARPRGPARNRTLLALEDRFFDIDTSTATSILLPETDGLPAYACYRLLSDNPAARLCLPSDLDGNGQPAGKGLFCNRGRCRDRKVLFVSAVPDLYEGAWNADVVLPGATTPVSALATTRRTSPGRIAMDVVLGTRDTLSLGMRLESDRRLRFAGERQTGTDAPVAVDGRGSTTRFNALEITADLTSIQGTTTLAMRRTDIDATPTGFGRCWLVTLREGTVETTLRLLLAISTNGLGASRPTEELADDGTVKTTLDAGDCAVTTPVAPNPEEPPIARVACDIPTTGGDLRLFGAMSLTPDVVGAGEYAFGPTGRAGIWRAESCPAN